MTLLELLVYVVWAAHMAFVLWVAVGGILALRWPRLLAVHAPVFMYAVVIETIRFQCPLTLIEKDLRFLAGMPNYIGGFIKHYIEPWLHFLPRVIYQNLGYTFVGINAVVYAVLIRRLLPRARSAAGGEPTDPASGDDPRALRESA